MVVHGDHAYLEQSWLVPFYAHSRSFLFIRDSTIAFFQLFLSRFENEKTKALIRLAGSLDEEIAAIACFDIGEFARCYPGGRMVAKRLGAKEIAMQWIDSENPDLQRHALQCVSKLMVQNWKVRLHT